MDKKQRFFKKNTYFILIGLLCVSIVGSLLIFFISGSWFNHASNNNSHPQDNSTLQQNERQKIKDLEKQLAQSLQKTQELHEKLLNQQQTKPQDADRQKATDLQKELDLARKALEEQQQKLHDMKHNNNQSLHTTVIKNDDSSENSEKEKQSTHQNTKNNHDDQEKMLREELERIKEQAELAKILNDEQARQKREHPEFTTLPPQEKPASKKEESDDDDELDIHSVDGRKKTSDTLAKHIEKQKQELIKIQMEDARNKIMKEVKEGAKRIFNGI